MEVVADTLHNYLNPGMHKKRRDVSAASPPCWWFYALQDLGEGGLRDQVMINISLKSSSKQDLSPQKKL